MGSGCLRTPAAGRLAGGAGGVGFCLAVMGPFGADPLMDMDVDIAWGIGRAVGSGGGSEGASVR